MKKLIVSVAIIAVAVLVAVVLLTDRQRIEHKQTEAAVVNVGPMPREVAVERGPMPRDHDREVEERWFNAKVRYYSALRFAQTGQPPPGFVYEYEPVYWDEPRPPLKPGQKGYLVYQVAPVYRRPGGPMANMRRPGGFIDDPLSSFAPFGGR